MPAASTRRLASLEPPNGKVPGAVPAQSIPNQVIDLYQAELNNDTDPTVGSP